MSRDHHSFIVLDPVIPQAPRDEIHDHAQRCERRLIDLREMLFLSTEVDEPYIRQALRSADNAIYELRNAFFQYKSARAAHSTVHAIYGRPRYE